MADPITWRNVTGPSIADASRPMESAANIFNAAFDPLQSVLKKREDTDLANFKQQKENNTNAFLNQLYQTHSPEEMAQLQASGKLQSMLDTFGAQIDQAKAREAMDTRLGTLQDQATKTITFNDAVRTEKDAPIIGAAKAKFSNGDFKGAMADIAQMSPQSQGIVMAELDKHRDDLVVRSQRDSKAAKELEQVDAQIANWKSTAASSALQAQAAWKNAGTNEADMLLRRRASDEDRLSKLTQQKLSLTTTISSPEGSKLVMDEITKLVPEGRDRLMMIESFGKMAVDPKFKDLTPSAALQAVAASVDSGHNFRKFFYNSTGDALTSNMEAALKTPDQLKHIAGRESAVENYDQQIEVLRRILYPEVYKNQPAVKPPVPTNPAVPGSAQPGAVAPVTPASPPPTTMSRNMQAEQIHQAQEIASGVRKAYSPEVQSAIQADKQQLDKFQGELDKRRVETSKALGLDVPVRPSDLKSSDSGTGDSLGTWGWAGSSRQNAAQKRYDAWVKAIDRRIQMEDATRK
jgi:hypothetical protein